MQEQRLTIRLQEYWNLIRKKKEIPDINFFNAAAVEDLWPYCSRMSVIPSLTPGFVCEYIGTPLIELYGMDLTGQPIEQNSQQNMLGPIIYKRLYEAATARKPVLHEGHFTSHRLSKIVKYRACLLPFGNVQHGVTHIIIGMSYRLS